jgi:beta-galactosidase
MTSEADAEHLAGYVQQGGNLLFGVRSGSKTPTNRVTDQPLPGLLRELVGAKVTGWQSVLPGVSFDLETKIAGMASQAAVWAEALEPEHGVDALARYTSGPFAGSAAMTRKQAGSGTASYLGYYPDLASAQTLLAHLANAYQIDQTGPLPDGMIAARRGGSTFLLNFTDVAHQVKVAGRDISVPARDLAEVKS